MCSEGYKPDEKEVGECKDCGGRVDIDGDSVEFQCYHSPEVCNLCSNHPCDESC